MPATCDLAARVEERPAARATRVCERVLRARGRSAGRPPAARCRSASCAAAGCWPSAAGPYATDAQHVSVEFVHPVIVGKRALPALDLSRRSSARGSRRSCAPDDIVMGFGPPEGDPRGRWRSLDARRRGAMTFALPGTTATTRSPRPIADAFIHQELIEILYHTLWETVHVFFEHRELGHDVGRCRLPLSVPRPARSRTPATSIARGGRIHSDEGRATTRALRAQVAERAEPTAICERHGRHRATVWRAAAS